MTTPLNPTMERSLQTQRSSDSVSSSDAGGLSRPISLSIHRHDHSSPYTFGYRLARHGRRHRATKWYCCVCHFQNSIANDASCTNCTAQHPWCRHCQTE